MSERASARIVVPFLIVTAIWGSTWLVIKDQISAVPPSWTVTYRFVGAGVGMLVLALVRRESLRISRQGLALTAAIGLLQFCGNFQFVYRAEAHLTSGIVAACFALLMVPNALFARVFLGEPISGRFAAGSLVAIGGIALLMLHEYRIAPLGEGGGVALGLLFTCSALLCASASNVLQASKRGRDHRPVPLLVWAMAWGVLINAVIAFAIDGPPIFDPRPDYLLGVGYLAIFGSVVTFPLYFALIRTIGAGRAAYSSVAVPMVAMALSTLFESYRWSVTAASGALLALAGLTIALSRGRAVAPTATAQVASNAASPSRNDG